MRTVESPPYNEIAQGLCHPYEWLHATGSLKYPRDMTAADLGIPESNPLDGTRLWDNSDD